MSKSQLLWEIAKWGGALFFLIATIVLFSPRIAATSTLPWVMFLLGNVLWVADNVKTRNLPWAAVGVIFALLDLLLIYTRMYGYDITPYMQPMLDIVEKIL